MMRDKDPELLAKLECVKALFAESTGEDPFLSESLRSAIEFAIAGESGTPLPLETFSEKALELSSQQRALPASFDLQHVNLRSRPYDALWVREELVKALKRLAGYEKAMLVVSGLNASILNGRRRSRRARERYDEARRFIDALAARFTASSCCVTIFYLD